MIVTDPSPSFGRLVTAFVVAPWVPAWTVVLLSAPSGVSSDVMVQYVLIGLLYGLVLTYPTVLVFGLPLFAVLRERVRLTVLGYTLIGVAVAPLPVLLIVAVGSVLIRPMPVDLFLVEMVARLAGLGALGGVTFWAVAAARWALTPTKTE